MISSVILAAGSSNRVNHETPKQFILFNKRRLLDYSVYTFEKYADEIIIIVPEKWKEIIRQENPKHKVVVGGKNRKASSYIGITSCNQNTKKVLIHDAARPFVQKKHIVDCIKKLDYFDGVSTVISPVDTIVKINKQKNKIKELLERDECRLEQTPQGFTYNKILKAHEAINDNVTDDIQIAYKFGLKCSFIDGSYSNFKVTTDFDLKMAQLMLKDK